MKLPDKFSILVRIATLLCALSGLCVCQSYAAPIAATPPQTPLPGAAGRTFYVSQKPIQGVADDLQFRTISEAAKLAQAGDTVSIATGVYREAVQIKNSGTLEKPIRFEAAPFANVTVTGVDPLLDWTPEPGPEGSAIYSSPWPYAFNTFTKEGHHPSEEWARLTGRDEQVFTDGYAMTQVTARDQMVRGSFFPDTVNKRLYVWIISNNKPSKSLDSGGRITASTRSILWEVSGEYVHTRGIRFRYAANRAQQGATQFLGRGDVAEDCIFEKTNGSGAEFKAPDQVARRCSFLQNGQLGWTANGAHNFLFTGNITRENNTKNFPRGWEAGGDKIILCRNITIENSQFIGNRGIGIWFDIGNENNTVRNCLIADNEDAGIFYEISYGLKAHDNVIVGNGLADTPGSWAMNGGIALSSSEDCVIERNLLIGNKEGFQFREQGRKTWKIGFKSGVDKDLPIWNQNHRIQNNVLAYNRDAQLWGWFDITDERIWPVAMQENKVNTAKAEEDNAAPYLATDKSGQPIGLELKDLKLTIDNNVYATAPNQEVFHWGAAWKRNKSYSDLNLVDSELKFEQNGAVAPLVFGDYLTRDFRVPADSPVLKMKAYPKGEVPGVQLGILPARVAAVQQEISGLRN